MTFVYKDGRGFGQKYDIGHGTSCLVGLDHVYNNGYDEAFEYGSGCEYSFSYGHLFYPYHQLTKTNIKTHKHRKKETF